MMLDNVKKIKNEDKGLVAKSIEFLPDQMRQVLDESRLIKIPSSFSKVTQVVVSGMGGSNLGAGIVKAALSDQIKLPLSIHPGYHVPKNVNEKTT